MFYPIFYFICLYFSPKIHISLVINGRIEMTRLKTMLDALFRKHGLVALKGGTEVEDMTFDEICYLKKLGEPDLPLIVKIGGPEARNDIRMLKSITIYGILSPMVESEYALRNFTETVCEIYGNGQKPYLAINIETITSYVNLNAIINSDAFRAVDQVTVGRSDLSRSMKMGVDDNRVISITDDIVTRVIKRGKKTSVGGSITPYNARLVADNIKTEKINTRHLLFDLNAAKDICSSIKYGLEFEIELYRSLGGIEPSKGSAYQSRIETTRKRLGFAEPAKRKVS
jgi:hypothetical protein